MQQRGGLKLSTNEATHKFNNITNFRRYHFKYLVDTQRSSKDTLDHTKLYIDTAYAVNTQKYRIDLVTCHLLVVR